MAEWRKFATKQHQKRSKKDKGKEEIIREEIIVQRMSSEVSGKQQKYVRIGARVYFDFEELSIENVKAACQKHFESDIDEGMVCDVLAGERGPSCKKLSQLTDTKTFFVRFINDEEREDGVVPTQVDKKLKCRTRRIEPAKSGEHPVGIKKAKTCFEASPSATSKVYPKSLSAVDMLRLGKVINKSSSTVVEIHKFDMEHMEWCSMPVEAEFMIDEKPFASGGFREAFKARSLTVGFTGCTWVLKKYLPKALEDIIETDHTPEQHTRKEVQAHHLARNFALQLTEKVRSEDLDYGPTFEYSGKVFMVRTDKGEFVTVEEFIEGEFIKYVNNNGDICVQDSEEAKKAESLIHFSYEKSHEQLMLLDIQGTGYKLYDPEIASGNPFDDQGKLQFCTGNLTRIAIDNFITFHLCNDYCKLLKLKLLPK